MPSFDYAAPFARGVRAVIGLVACLAAAAWLAACSFSTQSPGTGGDDDDHGAATGDDGDLVDGGADDDAVDDDTADDDATSGAQDDDNDDSATTQDDDTADDDHDDDDDTADDDTTDDDTLDDDVVDDFAECADDRDCPAGTRCDMGVCVDSMACRPTGICPDGMFCDGEICQPLPDEGPFCSFQEDCPDGLNCADGICAPPNRECPVALCQNACPTGYALDERGCETCACNADGDWFGCNSDDDCVRVSAGCCDCGMPEHGRAINVNAAEKYSEWLGNECAAVGQCACPPMPMPPNAFEAACRDGACALVDQQTGCEAAPDPSCRPINDGRECPAFDCSPGGPGCPPVAEPECSGGETLRCESDAGGCEKCWCESQCPPPPPCATTDAAECWVDFDGCTYCTCDGGGEVCPPLACDPFCPYGPFVDENGCDTCRCADAPACSRIADPKQCAGTLGCMSVQIECLIPPCEPLCERDRAAWCVNSGGSWDATPAPGHCMCPDGMMLFEDQCVSTKCELPGCKIACSDGFAVENGCPVCACR